MSTKVSSPAAPVVLAPLSPALARWGRGIIYALVVLYPVLFVPAPLLFFNSHDTPRRLVLLLAAGILGALILLAWAQRGRVIWRGHPIDLPLMLYGGALIISSLGAAYPSVSLFGYMWAQEFTLIMWGTCILLALAVKEFLREPGEVESTAMLMVFTGALVALIGLLDYLNARGTLGHLLHISWSLQLNPAFSGQRLVATMGNPMFTGTYLATLVPLGLGTALATRDMLRRGLLLVCTALILLSLFLTSARAAQLGMMLALVIMAVLLVRMREHIAQLPRWALPAVAVIGIGIVGLALLNPGVRGRFTSLFNTKAEDTLATRQVYMQGTFYSFCNRPITGWGPGSLRLIFPQYRPSSNIHELGMPLNRGFATAEPHNLLLQVTAESGLLGIIPFILLLGAAWRAGTGAFRRDGWTAWQSWGVLGMLLAYLISNLAAFDNSASMATGWIGLGLLGAITAQDRTVRVRVGDLPKALTPLACSLLRVACLVLMLGTVVHVAFEAISSYLTNDGVLLIGQSQNLTEMQPQLAWNTSVKAVDEIKAAMRFVPVLTWGGIRYGDGIQYDSLNLAYWTQIRLGPTNAERETAYDRMLAACTDGLTLVDRSPKLLRRLAVEYTDNYAMYQDKARTIVQSLLGFEPNSAEVLLLSARLNAANNALDQAVTDVEKALKLDPTFANAWAYMGEYKDAEMRKGRNRDDEHIKEIIADYTMAERYGLDLDPEDRVIYASNLALFRRADDVIYEGRFLRFTDKLQELEDKIRIIYGVYKQPQEAERIITAILRPRAPGMRGEH